MKTSFISSLSIQNALRLTISQTQKELVRTQQESVTGKHYDMGIALAEKTAQSLDMNREVDRLSSLATANSLVTTRMGSSQAAMEVMSESGQDILDTILAFGGNEDAKSLETSKTTVRNALTVFTEKANMSVNGEYLFAGINTDVQPMADFLATGSPAKAAFDTELNYFLGQQTPPLTDKSQMSAVQMKDFLGVVEKKFSGESPLTSPPHAAANAGKDFWTTFVSKASDTNMMSRISKGEVVQTSVNANADSMRYMVLGAVVTLEFMDTSVSTAARAEVKTAAQNYIAAGISDLTAQRGKLGLSEERVKKANESIEAQKTIISKYLNDLEGIDETEAATRMKNLLSLVDASYTLTARIQQLSLVNFL